MNPVTVVFAVLLVWVVLAAVLLLFIYAAGESRRTPRQTASLDRK